MTKYVSIIFDSLMTTKTVADLVYFFFYLE